MSYITFLWLGLMLLFLVVEAATVGIVSIWFAAGALVSCLLSIFIDSLWVQIFAFLLVSGVLLAFTRPFIKKRMLTKQIPTNADMAIGKRALVEKAIQPDIHGRVKLDGLSWAAASDSSIDVGEWCVVTAISGATLTVIPAEKADETPAAIKTDEPENKTIKENV